MTQESTTNATTDKPAADSNRATQVLEESKNIDDLLKATVDEGPKTEVSATTIGKMMGLATTKELKLLEGKMDLLTGRIANLGIRLERALTILGSAPTGADIERLDVQVANLRSMLKDFITKAGGEPTKEEGEEDTKAKLDAFLKRHNGGEGGGDGAA